MPEQPEAPTRDVLELDRLAWNLPIALRPLPSQPQSCVEPEREDKQEAGPEAA